MRSPKTFAVRFAAEHGRPPREDEWPKPRFIGAGYEWLQPELALLARLVGRLGPSEITGILTTRLRQVTGDRRARRTLAAYQARLQRLGLVSSDVVGGVTVEQGAREIGTRSIIDHEIRLGKLPTTRVGRLLVIPHAAWQAWKAARVFPPQGFIRLAKLRKALGIRSDKLSEWARLGYIPTAIRCNPTGTREHSTQWGTWYIDPKMARKILADRRAGRPMPWWGKPELGNLKVTWPRWQKRKHPPACTDCRAIWGKAGPPRTFDDFVRQYPPLTHGAKRHLTRPWSPGITPAQLATEAGVSPQTVTRAIEAGVLRARRFDDARGYWITRTDATLWKDRDCPTGDSAKSWLAIATACRRYGFTRRELNRWIRRGRLKVKVGDFGAQIGVHLVPRQQVRELRDEIGYSEREAARRARVSVARLRVLLRGLEWRPAPRIPMAVVQSVIRRQESSEGRTLAEAARELGKTVAWVRNEINAGTFRVQRTRWNPHRLYVPDPMFRRLQRAARRPTKRVRWSAEWMLVSDAAIHAGVCATTIMRWGEERWVAVRRHPTQKIRTYHRRSVMKQARRYWATCRKRSRATPPAWLRAA